MLFPCKQEIEPAAVVLPPYKSGHTPTCCLFIHQVLATASAVSRANMATSDWLRPFDFDRVFWSIPGQAIKDGEDSVASEQATQQEIFEGLGEKIVEDVLNVSVSAV